VAEGVARHYNSFILERFIMSSEIVDGANIGKIKSSTEKCISCGVETNVPVALHVDCRYFYIDGAGQCCKECFEKFQ
jgi:hypothetical protein